MFLNSVASGIKEIVYEVPQGNVLDHSLFLFPHHVMINLSTNDTIVYDSASSLVHHISAQMNTFHIWFVTNRLFLKKNYRIILDAIP